jgi:hypothetical protein
MQDTVISEVRIVLQRWGAWWRWQEQRELGYASAGPGYQLMQLAKLGCRIQSGIRHDRSEDIQPPGYIAQVDQVVESLPQAQRAALVAFYVRRPGLRRCRVRSRVLLRAEMRVGIALR